MQSMKICRNWIIKDECLEIVILFVGTTPNLDFTEKSLKL